MKSLRSPEKIKSYLLVIAIIRMHKPRDVNREKREEKYHEKTQIPSVSAKHSIVVEVLPSSRDFFFLEIFSYIFLIFFDIFPKKKQTVRALNSSNLPNTVIKI